MDDSLIRVEHVWRYYAAACALSDVSFEVRRGEVLGFLGPNGAGKSTTMNILTGNLAPSRGRVWINGVDLLDEPKRAKRALGYLPEHPPLYLELTVDEYLDYCARLRGLRGGALRKARDLAKQRCGLTAAGKRLIGNLSKGYQQRVGLAQALVHEPPVLMLDEPTVGLDPLQMREMRALIRELGRERALILSSHILPEVQATCDRVLIIHQGRIVLSDSIEGLSRRMHASSLRVVFRGAPQAEALSAIPGVQRVEREDNMSWRIYFEPPHSPAEAITAQAAEQGWGLIELTPERLTLEDVFMHITCTEQPAAS
ncbi:MAG: ATP-binding cassette domain-containing protein [Gammaproteobacteria bacterium]|nr:MAG: ATP-binding cassette domain-containing protein [Gammaproteobacteria bacterium]